MQFRQFTRGQKRWLGAFIFIIAYCWFFEFMTLVLFKGAELHNYEMIRYPLCVSALLMDFFYKLILERDRTVMDAFLKTRPVSQIRWNQFLTVFQFWNPINLLIPLAIAPACFMLFPFPESLAVWLGMYLLSVLGGLLMMKLKRRGKYQVEKAVSTRAAHTFKSDTGHLVFGLQLKSFLRSKRLRTTMIMLSVVFLVQYISQGFQDFARQHNMDTFWLFAILYFIAINIPQFGLGIEANFISGIWTRPVPVYRILRDKFRLSALLTGIAFLICLPISLWVGTPWYLTLSFALFAAGFGALLVLTDAYHCTPFDLFGKTFFNHQGSAGTYKVSTLINIVIMLAVAMLFPTIFPDWLSSLLLAGLGLIGFAVHRPVLRWVERNFIKNKYKYLESYLSK